MYHVGLLYRSGHGVPKNPAAAFRWSGAGVCVWSPSHAR
jgi:hypothetical protein